MARSLPCIRPKRATRASLLHNKTEFAVAAMDLNPVFTASYVDRNFALYSIIVLGSAGFW